MIAYEGKKVQGPDLELRSFDISMIYLLSISQIALYVFLFYSIQNLYFQKTRDGLVAAAISARQLIQLIS